jgi:hypothetical protein
VLPETATVVERAKALPEIVLGHPPGDDAAPEEHLPEARPLLLEEGDHLQRQTEIVLLVQAADLEGGDDTQRPVPLAAVSVRVAVRPDPEHRLPLRSVPRDERADWVLRHTEPELLELGREVVQRPAVLGRVRVANDGLARPREIRSRERLDVALDASGAPLSVDCDHGPGP